MQTLTKTLPEEEWVKVLTKGLITIPKSFREQLNIKEGEVARIRKVGWRLVIEPREIADYEVYSDDELKTMLKEDELPVKMTKKVGEIWPDLV